MEIFKWRWSHNVAGSEERNTLGLKSGCITPVEYTGFETCKKETRFFSFLVMAVHTTLFSRSKQLSKGWRAESDKCTDCWDLTINWHYTRRAAPLGGGSTGPVGGGLNGPVDFAMCKEKFISSRVIFFTPNVSNICERHDSEVTLLQDVNPPYVHHNRQNDKECQKRPLLCHDGCYTNTFLCRNTFHTTVFTSLISRLSLIFFFLMKSEKTTKKNSTNSKQRARLNQNFDPPANSNSDFNSGWFDE